MSVSEALGNTPMSAALAAGLEQISENDSVTFTKYIRVVLPLDGFVFWVRADLLAGLNYITSLYHNNQTDVTPHVFETKGSLHYAINRAHDHDQTTDINSIIFTTDTTINEFNIQSNAVQYFGEYDGLKFTFSSQKNFYKVANIYHYMGQAVQPAQATQIVDDLTKLDYSNVVMSNSMPIWLSLNQFIDVYPEYLVDSNLIPPYASISIKDTSPLQADPYTDQESSRWQLNQEKVVITLYGARNDQALDVLDYIRDQTLLRDDYGLMNSPNLVDEKRTQAEMGVIAMKKRIDAHVNYYQIRIRDIARQMILQVIPTVYQNP